MSDIILQPASVPVDAPMPVTLQQIINAVAAYLRLSGVEGLEGVIISATEPDPADRDKVWARLDGATSRPIGLFVYQGGWKAIPVIPVSGDVRPGNPRLGEQFWDTTVNCTLVYNGVKWVTEAGQTGDVKFVNATTLVEALRLNPGWIQFTAASGRVIAAAGSGGGLTTRAVGEIFGNEEVTLEVDHLPSHTHPLASAASVRPNIDLDLSGPDAGANNAPLSATGATGGGEPHENTQPTIALWCLIKQ